MKQTSTGQEYWGGGTSWAFSHPPLPPRSHLAEATALYSLVDEQLHVLVTTSNHLLGRLELRVRMGRLEAAIHQVKGEAAWDMGGFCSRPCPSQALGLVQGPEPLVSKPPSPPQVSNWMEQEGSRRLQALTPKDGSLETVQKAHLEFEDFFLQAAVSP